QGRAEAGKLRGQGLVDSGNAAYRNSDYTAAAKRYAAAAVVNPDDPAAFYGLGMALAKLGRDDEARVAYARSRELSRGELDHDAMPREVRYRRTAPPEHAARGIRAPAVDDSPNTHRINTRGSVSDAPLNSSRTRYTPAGSFLPGATGIEFGPASRATVLASQTLRPAASKSCSAAGPRSGSTTARLTSPIAGLGRDPSIANASRAAVSHTSEPAAKPSASRSR